MALLGIVGNRCSRSSELRTLLETPRVVTGLGRLIAPCRQASLTLNTTRKNTGEGLRQKRTLSPAQMADQGPKRTMVSIAEAYKPNALPSALSCATHNGS